MMRRLLLLVLATTCVAPCFAEVRLARNSRGRAEVRVIPTESGPWTPIDSVGPAVLNPEGDINGDGAPAVATSDASWLVAWNSPSHEALQLARAVDGWQPIVSVSAPEAVGTPVIVGVDGGWLVATRTRRDGVSVAGLVDAPRGRASELIELGHGRLIGGRRADGGAQFILLGEEGCLEIHCVRMIVPDPMPIDVYRHVVCLPPPAQRLPAPRDPIDPRAPGPGGCGRGFAPPDGRDGDDGGCDGSRSRQAPVRLVPSMRLQEIMRPDGSTSGAVTWTSGDENGFLDLSEDGPLVPVMTRSAESARRR